MYSMKTCQLHEFCNFRCRLVALPFCIQPFWLYVQSRVDPAAAAAPTPAQQSHPGSAADTVPEPVRQYDLDPRANTAPPPLHEALEQQEQMLQEHPEQLARERPRRLIMLSKKTAGNIMRSSISLSASALGTCTASLHYGCRLLLKLALPCLVREANQI